MDDWQIAPSTGTVIVIVIVILVIVGLVFLIIALVNASQTSNPDPPPPGPAGIRNVDDADEDDDDAFEGGNPELPPPNPLDEEAREAQLASVEEFIIPESGSDVGLPSASGDEHAGSSRPVLADAFGPFKPGPGVTEEIIVGSFNDSGQNHGPVTVEEVILDLDELGETVQWEHPIQLPPPPVAPANAARPPSPIKLAPPPGPIAVFTQQQPKVLVNNPIITLIHANTELTPPTSSGSHGVDADLAAVGSLVSSSQGPSDSIPDASELTASEAASAAAHAAAKATRTDDTPLIESMKKPQNQEPAVVSKPEAVVKPVVKPTSPKVIKEPVVAAKPEAAPVIVLAAAEVVAPPAVAEVAAPPATQISSLTQPVAALYGPAPTASKSTIDETSGKSVDASMTNPASLSSDFSSATDKSGRTQVKRVTRNPAAGLAAIGQTDRGRARSQGRGH